MKKFKFTLILLIALFTDVVGQNTVGVELVVGSPMGGTQLITVRYCANGEFQSSDNSDEWQTQVITLGWIPATGIVSSGGSGSAQITNFTSTNLPFVGAFNPSVIIAFALNEIGGVDDGNIYTGFVTTAAQDGVSIPNGTCIDVFSFEIPESTSTDPNSLFLKEDNTGAGSFQLGADIKNSAFAGNRWDLVPAATPLPIELHSFQAEKSGNSAVALEWITATEINSDHFEIERSIDGTKWQFIGQVAANGNSIEQIKYTHLDSGLDIASVNRYYYRLKLVDLDGSYDYSAVRSVDFVGNKEGKASFSVYPNPTNDAINISLTDVKEDSNVSLKVYDMNGKLIHSEVMSTVNDNRISVANWSIGSYNAIISIDNKELLSKKILVQK